MEIEVFNSSQYLGIKTPMFRSVEYFYLKIYGQLPKGISSERDSTAHLEESRSGHLETTF
jgi:hypothetical protein